ncbi:MAG: hypothetical protein IKX04_08005 [Clostridiales bacterium]|nr:hypothetical protein [Clostridiales bacterium]MBR5058494.1 hypothetical protein [Clostridiales bacterium]
MLFIGLVIGSLLTGMIVYKIFAVSFYKKKRDMKFLNAANGVSNSVLNIVQMGVVAFTDNGTLLFNNKTCLKKLRVEELPQSFTEFVEKFVHDEQVLVDLQIYESLLPKTRPQENEDDILESEKLESVTTRVEIRNRIIQFHFSKPFFPQSTLRGWVVVLEDVTKAARQEQQRRLFVSTVSHELKTPLASINGYSESLIDWGLREKSPDQIFNDVLKINEEGHRITEIISNLTFLSQIENNKDKIDMTVYRIDKTVEEVCRKYTEEANKKNIRLYYESLTRVMPPVFGSKSMMEQMVGNLINNALKYSSENTNIWVFIQAHETTVTIKVQDQGKGIPKPAAEKVFQAFFRVDETGARSAGGSGLGLAIVKMMAEVQEGEISLVTRCPEDDDSQRSEVGSDFYITVPTAAATFKETLEAMRDGADREEVLYRKAKQYMEKINEDDYDLGYDLKKIDKKEDEERLISHLIFIDECDIIEDSSEPVPEEPAVEASEEPAKETASPFVQPVVRVEAEPEVIRTEPSPFVRPVPAPEAAAPKIKPEIRPVEQQEAEVVQVKTAKPEEWVSLSKRGATVLKPDAPALKRPILSKETIGSQNAEKRRQARKNTVKKTREEAVPEPLPEVRTPALPKMPEPPSPANNAAPATRSLLRQVTDPVPGKSADTKTGMQE